MLSIKGGGSPLKILITLFRVSDWPRMSTQWANSLVGLESPRTLGAQEVTTPISRQKWPKNQNWKISIVSWFSHHQSIDNSLLSSHKIFQPNRPKKGWVMAKNHMLKYGNVLHFLGILWPNTIFFGCNHHHSICTNSYMFSANYNSIYAKM